MFQFYEPILLSAIRPKLPTKVRSKFDSLDVTQDVWISFFRVPPEQRAFENPEALIRFLTQLAKNKVIDAVRQRMKTKKTNVNHERSLDGSLQFIRDGLLAPDPSPSLLMSTEEEWTAFLGRQPLVYRRIFILLRQGKERAEIARELGIHERTVRRVADKLLRDYGDEPKPVQCPDRA